MLISIILGKSVVRGLYDEPVNKPYRKLEVDDMPIIETLEKLDYKKLLVDYQTKHDKPLKPVVRRKNSVVKVPARLTCPKCSAPSNYLYANNGDKGQYKCKVCDCLFSQKNRFLKEAIESIETQTNLFNETVEGELVYFHQIEQYFMQQKLLEDEQKISRSEMEKVEKELTNSLQHLDITLKQTERNQQQQEAEYLIEKDIIESQIQNIEHELENEKKLKASIEKNENLIPSSDEKRTIFFQTYQAKLEQLDALSGDQLMDAQQSATKTEIKTYKNETLLTVHAQIDEYNSKLEQLNQNLTRLNNGNDSSNTDELLLQKESIKQQLETLQTNQDKQTAYRENTVEKYQLDRLLEENIQQLNQRLREGEITAPIRGKVNVIQDVANGDIVQQGERILSILPIEESEFKMNIAVPNHEVGKINLGDSINYNFTAFPKQNYGQLTGTVTSISTDSTVQEDGNSYYLVEATLDQTAIEDREGHLKPIRSGMSAEASVVTETKKIIHFVLEKINLKD